MRSAIAVVALLLAGCALPPPVRLETEHGVVRAQNRDEAERVASTLRLAPEIRLALASDRDDRIVVWAVDTSAESPRNALGICYERRIDLMREAIPHTRTILAHELVHWYVRESPYAGMPYFVEEGLADWLATGIGGLRPARDEELQRMGSVTVTLQHLAYDYDGYCTLSLEQARAIGRLGYHVVSRIGLERLRELAESCAEPVDYLDAAGLEPDYASTRLRPPQ